MKLMEVADIETNKVYILQRSRSPTPAGVQGKVFGAEGMARAEAWDA